MCHSLGNRLRDFAPNTTLTSFPYMFDLKDVTFKSDGKTSLFGSVLARVGFANAWDGAVNGWAFHNGDVSDLAKMGDVQFAYVEPVAPPCKTACLIPPSGRPYPLPVMVMFTPSHQAGPLAGYCPPPALPNFWPMP